MDAKRRRIHWRDLEKGQALVEYWPTFPAAVAVLLAASIIVPFLNKSYSAMTGGLQNAPICEEAPIVEPRPQFTTTKSKQWLRFMIPALTGQQWLLK
jgi:hypothetical protein